jgi:hypothetical protein
MNELSRRFREIAEEQDALRARSPAKEGLRRRIAALHGLGAEARPSRARRALARLLLPAAAAAAALAALVFFVLRERDVLEVRVGQSGAPPLIGAWLGAPDDARLPLVFSDGTRMVLAPKSKARLRDVRREGARVELANGSLRVAVVPRAASSFWIDAGPFTVHVTGTRFDVDFDPADESFALALEEGHVELSGCVFGKSKRLAAGQTVRASCSKRTVAVDYGERPGAVTQPTPKPSALPEPEQNGSLAPAEQEASNSAPSDVERAPDRPGHTPESAARARSDWIALAKQGAYAAAFEQARAAGFEEQCARRNAVELALLADVARHAGAPRETRHALLALRRRFPETDEAALAAFTLGRMEFDGRGSARGASEWFRTYLRERPRGAMTREALGRLIEAFRAAGDAPAARDVARRYLREYPSGPHAELASRVLSSP